MAQSFRTRTLNIENNPRCTLQCPTCKRTDFKEKYGQNVPLPGKDLTLVELKKCLKYFNSIAFCGQHSDPIFGKYFYEMLKICKENNVHTSVHTAASHRPEDWWRKAFLANTDAHWIFGIDGPPELSHKYRVNQDGEHLFNMMCIGKELGINVSWQYIIFNYNEDYIDDCTRLAKSKNISIELIIPSRGLPESLMPKSNKYNWRNYEK